MYYYFHDQFSRSVSISSSNPKKCKTNKNCKCHAKEGPRTNKQKSIKRRHHRRRGKKAPEKSLWRKLMANSIQFYKQDPKLKEYNGKKVCAAKWSHLINEPMPHTPVVVPPLTETSIGIIKMALPRLQRRQRLSKEPPLSLILEL